MLRCLTLLLLCALAFGSALAQPDPAKQPAAQPARPAQNPLPPPNAIVMEPTPLGLFVIGGGILVKYDPLTLQQREKLELLEPLPAQPAGNDPANPEMQRWRMELMKRNTPPGVLMAGETLILVLADQVFCVNQRTMQVTGKANLSDPRMPTWNYQTPPLMKTQDDILYVMRYPFLAAVNLKTGVVLGRGAIPGMNFPQFPPNPPPVENRPGQPGAQPGAQPQQVVLIGMVQKAGQDGAWVLRDDAKTEYLLQGEPLQKLLATPQLAGARVRIQGILTRPAGAARGSLKIERFEVLK